MRKSLRVVLREWAVVRRRCFGGGGGMTCGTIELVKL